MKLSKADIVQYAWGHGMATIGIVSEDGLMNDPIYKTIILGALGGVVSLVVKDAYQWCKKKLQGKKATKKDPSDS